MVGNLKPCVKCGAILMRDYSYTAPRFFCMGCNRFYTQADIAALNSITNLPEPKSDTWIGLNKRWPFRVTLEL